MPLLSRWPMHTISTVSPCPLKPGFTPSPSGTPQPAHVLLEDALHPPPSLPHFQPWMLPWAPGAYPQGSPLGDGATGAGQDRRKACSALFLSLLAETLSWRARDFPDLPPCESAFAVAACTSTGGLGPSHIPLPRGIPPTH